MIRPSFLALAWRSQAAESYARHILLSAASTYQNLASFEIPGLILLAPAASTMRSGDALLVGELFSRSNDALDTLPEERAEVSAADFLKSLLDRCWGGYVAFRSGGGGGISILRDPSGAIPCYFSDVEGLRCFASNAEIFREIGVSKWTVNWSNLAFHVAKRDLLSEATCINGITELLPGSCAESHQGSWSVSAKWSPWKFASRDAQFEDGASAAAELRSVVLGAVAAAAAKCANPILELSGGLDSSVIGAALGATNASFRAVHMEPKEPAFSEERYARAVARHLRAILHVEVLDIKEEEVLRPPIRRYPRPGAHHLSRIFDRRLAEISSSLCGDSFFGGSGGDYLLGNFGTSAPAADAFRHYGLSRQFLWTANQVAKIHRASVWRAMRLAIVKAHSQDRVRYRNPFISDQAEAANAPLHPWLMEGENGLPGKREQILGLVGGRDGVESRERNLTFPCRQPFLSQPVVEVCLRIPSWLSVADGRDRSVARRAFADLLPNVVVNRRTKGNFATVNRAIFERLLPNLPELLLGGRLVQEDITIAAGIEAALSNPDHLDDRRMHALLDIAKAEMWCRSSSPGPR